VKYLDKVRLPKWAWWAIAAFAALQIYFVRELIAAELLFLLLFGVALFTGFAIWLIGAIGERSLAWTEARARQAAELVTEAAKRSSSSSHSTP